MSARSDFIQTHQNILIKRSVARAELKTMMAQVAGAVQ